MTSHRPPPSADGFAVVSGLASRAGLLADQVRARAVDLRRCARTQWRSGAADAYEAGTLLEVARLERCAGELDAVAAALAGHARRAEHRRDEIDRVFREAQRLLDAVLPPARGGRP